MHDKAMELINMLANSIYDREKSLTTQLFFTSTETALVKTFLEEFEAQIKSPQWTRAS